MQIDTNVNQLFAPQGWQCPICGRVYSPVTAMCFYCGNTSITTTQSSHYIPGTVRGDEKD
jgi:hypothetical protein